jgi:hypothetical protein
MMLGLYFTAPLSSAYKSLTRQEVDPPGITCFARVAVMISIRSISCLLIHSRLNSRALLQRKNFFMADYTCIVCSPTVKETRDHLFFKCPFAFNCWKHLCSDWSPHVDAHTNIQQSLQSLKVQIALPSLTKIVMLIP